ncbi:MAG TPA: hypothetical protein VFH73_11855 [Polyangia bacterium]|jgi:hypothetical protein|nr:hypothetical protein [Polyangia bacterium]
MRGPLLSGAVGSAASLQAVVRWAAGAQPVVVLGPLWLGETLAQALKVVMLVEADDRASVKRARRRAVKAGRALEIALAGAELPMPLRSVSALVVENVAGLEAAAAANWLGALVPTLRPGGRLIAVDATSSTSAMARVAGVFLASSLIGLIQERPRDGVVLTVGMAPSAAVMAARFPSTAAGASAG